jgi:drug/metabolite transporter (DMT)-like permease
MLGEHLHSSGLDPTDPDQTAKASQSSQRGLQAGRRPIVSMQVLSQRDYVRRILPLGFCSAATLALGNIAYLYLDVGLLQMLKSCCPVFVMLVAIACRLERASISLVASILFIAAGTATTAATGMTSQHLPSVSRAWVDSLTRQDSQAEGAVQCRQQRSCAHVCVAGAGVGAVSVVGLLVQFSSEMCEALRLCLAQLLMCNMALHQFEVLRLMSSACVVFLCIGIWLMEWHRFVAQRAWQRILLHPHWYLAAGVCSTRHCHVLLMNCGPWTADASIQHYSAMHRRFDDSCLRIRSVTCTHAAHVLINFACCAASLGFLLNLLAFAVIKLTGSLTQKVLGTVKNVLLVLFSVFFMSEQVTLQQWIGYQVSLLGFVWYQHQKITAASAITIPAPQRSPVKAGLLASPGDSGPPSRAGSKLNTPSSPGRHRRVNAAPVV